MNKSCWIIQLDKLGPEHRPGPGMCSSIVPCGHTGSALGRCMTQSNSWAIVAHITFFIDSCSNVHRNLTNTEKLNLVIINGIRLLRLSAGFRGSLKHP